MKIEHKVFSAEVKKFDDANLIVEHFISTEHKDRGGDIMRAKGMKIVGKPVVLMLHGRGPMASEPIAKPLSITVDEFKGQPGILAKTQFFPDEVGTRLYQKIKGGFIPNWSIGYAVDEAKDIMESGRYAGRDVTKWQLLEYSPVGVPMNPFAQTIKEFLDKTEKGEEVKIEESSWFGLVEEKSCTGCGACADHGNCHNCKGPITFFAKGEDLLGKACEKCQPEEFAKLKLGIEPPESETPMEKFKKDAAALGIIFPDDSMKEFNEKFTALEGQVAEQLKTITGLIEAVEEFKKGVAKLEPLLATLPPEPDGEKKGEEEHHDNPPEKKTPPRLVVVRDEETPEAKQQAQKARILAIAREVLDEAAKQEIDRLKGRVP